MQYENKEIELLKQLGLNNLESEVYLHLLTNKPMTAYKVGKEINKPTANVYKAIDALSKKGAVIIEDNNNKHCKAVHSDEFISHYEKDVLSKANAAKTVLQKLEKKQNDEKTYSINSVPLIFERFESMMQKCKVVAVIDAFPLALNKVLGSVNQAIERGVDVFVQTYDQTEIKGANVAYTEKGETALSYWQSQQLNLITDGEEHLISLMNNELNKVIQAVWSNNIYMSCILHAGRLQEQTVIKIMSKMNHKDFEKEVKELIKKQKFFFNSNIPGFNKLFKNR